MHLNTQTMGAIKGVLYQGDARTKYSKPNSPTIMQFTDVQPKELSLLM